MSLREGLARRALFPLVAAVSRSGFWGTVHRRLAELERRQWWPAERIRADQLARLRTLVRHASDRVPFYRDRFRSLGMEPDDLRSEEDFARIPALTRQDLRERYRDLVAEGWDGLVEENATGGSCGQPVRFAIDPDETAMRAAMAIRHNRWARWDVGDRAGVLWGAPRDLVNQVSLRERMASAWLTPKRSLNAFNMTPDNMLGFAAGLRRWRAQVLFGYAGALVEFGRVLQASGQTIPSLRSVVSSAEALSEGSRRAAEQAFGCPVYDRYGARETGLIASECEARESLHVASEDVYVEIDNSGQEGLGRVLVTKLNVYGMPFIRYDIGDFARWEWGRCMCGRQMPRLTLAGCRTTDFLIGADGRLVSGAALTLITRDLPEVGTVQLFQPALGRVEVRVAGHHDLPDWVRRAMCDRLHAYLGPVGVSFTFPEQLERAPSGKYRFTVCSLGGHLPAQPCE